MIKHGVCQKEKALLNKAFVAFIVVKLFCQNFVISICAN